MFTYYAYIYFHPNTPLQKIIPNAPYPLLQSNHARKPKQFLRFRNHWSTAHRVILCPREVFHRERATPIVATPVAPFIPVPPVPVPRPPQRTPKHFHEFVHREFAPRVADIHRPYITHTRLRSAHKRNQSTDGVIHVTKRPGLRPIPIDCYRRITLNLPNKIGNHPPVIQVHARPIRIE